MGIIYTGPILYATANISERKVFWVAFSLRELVSLMTILVMMKQPAAKGQMRREKAEAITSHSRDCSARHHHSPGLGACTQGTADKEDEDARLHDNVSPKDVGNLSIGREEGRVGQDVRIRDPRLVWQLIKRGGNV